MSTIFDLRYLRYFIAVAEELNFTRAAERLHTVQPSLSQQIKRLEEIVGTPLFWRDKHHLQLSAAGAVFLEQARKILQCADDAVESARRAGRAETGRLTVSFPPSVEAHYTDFLHVLRVKYPSVQIYLRNLQSLEQVEALRNHSIDVGFTSGPSDDNGSIEFELIACLKTLAILPASHPLAKLRAVPIMKLALLPLVRPSCLLPAPNRIIEEISNQNGVRFRNSVEVDNLLATVNAVASGAGFALVPEHVGLILTKGVVAKPIEMKTQPCLEIFLAYRKDNLSPALQLFVRTFREYVKAHTDHERTVSR